MYDMLLFGLNFKVESNLLRSYGLVKLIEKQRAAYGMLRIAQQVDMQTSPIDATSWVNWGGFVGLFLGWWTWGLGRVVRLF